jgi:hypothetical protein
VNPRYNGLTGREGGGSVIADVSYNEVMGYSGKYIIGYIVNTCDKHINTQCDYIGVIFHFK